MGKMIVINGSPRGGRSNTRLYSEAMTSVWPDEHVAYNVVRRRPAECLEQLDGCTDILLAFPLYTDGLPSGLVELLGQLLEAGIDAESRVHVLVNCGFREPSQCAVALEIRAAFLQARRLQVWCEPVHRMWRSISGYAAYAHCRAEVAPICARDSPWKLAAVDAKNAVDAQIVYTRGG